MTTARMVKGTNGKPMMEFSSKFNAETASDVLRETINRGAISQKALGEAIIEGLKERGFNRADNGKYGPNHFSETAGKADSTLYEAVEAIGIILDEQKETWLLEFFAARCGKKLVDGSEEVYVPKYEGVTSE